MEEQPKKRKADWIGLDCNGRWMNSRSKADWIRLDWNGRWKNSRRNVKQKEPWDGMHNAEKEEEPGLKMEIKRDATVVGCGAEN
jgi:hypothetical protein